jgi:hypothetical protein
LAEQNVLQCRNHGRSDTLEGLDYTLDETEVNATPTKEDEATTTTTVEETIDSSIEHEEPPAIEDGTTRSGMRFRDITAANVVLNPVELTHAEEKYLCIMKTLCEIACVGAGLGGGFEHTTELHVMKYDAAMKTADANSWKMAVEEEHNRMVENESGRQCR